MDTKQAKQMKSAFNFLKNAPDHPTPQSPITAPVAPMAPPVVQAPAKPTRTVGNIYSAVQAQAIFNPGQPTPPDPAGGSTQQGPIGSNPDNLTIKGPPAKQVELGTSGNLQPQTGWGKTNG